MVQWAAGEDITASKLSTTRLVAVADAEHTLTTTESDVSGMSLTFTTTRDDVVVHAAAVLDIELNGGDGNVGIGRLNVDGTNETEEVHGQGNDATARRRWTLTQQWVVTLASAGSHTLKMRALRSGGTANDISIRGVHSILTLIVEDNV